MHIYELDPPRLLHTISSYTSSNIKKKKSRSNEMAPSFARSISFPLTPARSSKPRHVRSNSLPCSSHPLLAHLNAQIAAVRSWIQDPATPASGIAHIHALHAALADLLLLQDPQDVLRRATSAGDRLLDAFLLLADAHQGFQESLVELRHAAAESRAALLRQDTARLASAVRSQRSAGKDLARIVASVSSISSKSSRLNFVSTDAVEAEMAGTLMEAASASAAASMAVFSAVASMSSPSATSSCKIVTSAFGSFGKKAVPETAEAAMERLHAIECSLEECECMCDKVFRSIVQTRVSLLNIMTPTI